MSNAKRKEKRTGKRKGREREKDWKEKRTKKESVDEQEEAWPPEHTT
jgi:hypothetical protein